MQYTFLLELAIILLSTKLLGMLMKKIGLPQVVGALIAGILIGPAIWSPLSNGSFIPVKPSEFLNMLAELGVVLIMFSAGLETDFKELKRSGAVATFIAALGVIVPLAFGFLIAIPFFSLSSAENVLTCVFVGVIITATSVSITVETLRELGKLKGKIGTTILSAAIIDDVIGIIILTFIIGMKNPSAGSPSYMIIINTVLFFLFAIGIGIVLNLLFKWLSKKYPNRRRLPVLGLVVCLLYAYCAEHFFGIADITGAYIAGICLSNLNGSSYIDKKIDINSYMIFSPVFFASIGIKTSFADFKPEILLFALCFVLAGIFGKIIGCGVAAKVTKFSFRDSLKIGIGMIARGEVALIVAQKGIAAGLIPSIYLTAVVLLVIMTSFLTPILLKILFKDKELPLSGQGINQTAESENTLYVQENNIQKDEIEENVCSHS